MYQITPLKINETDVPLDMVLTYCRRKRGQYLPVLGYTPDVNVVVKTIDPKTGNNLYFTMEKLATMGTSWNVQLRSTKDNKDTPDEKCVPLDLFKSEYEYSEIETLRRIHGLSRIDHVSLETLNPYTFSDIYYLECKGQFKYIPGAPVIAKFVPAGKKPTKYVFSQERNAVDDSIMNSCQFSYDLDLVPLPCDEKVKKNGDRRDCRLPPKGQDFFIQNKNSVTLTGGIPYTAYYCFNCEIYHVSGNESE